MLQLAPTLVHAGAAAILAAAVYVVAPIIRDAISKIASPKLCWKTRLLIAGFALSGVLVILGAALKGTMLTSAPSAARADQAVAPPTVASTREAITECPRLPSSEGTSTGATNHQSELTGSLPNYSSENATAPDLQSPPARSGVTDPSNGS